MRISASDIAAWRYCPRAFYYERVEGRRKPINENLVRGTLIHLIYEQFFTRKLFENADAFESFLKEDLDKAIENEDGRISKLKMDKDKLREFLINSAKKLLIAFNDGRISIPTSNEQKVDIPEFVARVDAIFEKQGLSLTVADVKIKIRDLESVKLQLSVAAIILEQHGKKVEKGLAIDAEKWKEFEVDLTEELKKEVWNMREKILKMYETKEKPPCTCGRCDLAV